LSGVKTIIQNEAIEADFLERNLTLVVYLGASFCYSHTTLWKHDDVFTPEREFYNTIQ